MRTLTINGLTRYCQWRVLWTLGKNGLMTHSFRDSAAHSEPSPTSKVERFCNNCFHKRLHLDIWLGSVNGELFVRMLPVLSILSSRQRHYNVSAKWWSNVLIYRWFNVNVEKSSKLKFEFRRIYSFFLGFLKSPDTFGYLRFSLVFLVYATRFFVVVLSNYLICLYVEELIKFLYPVQHI